MDLHARVLDAYVKELSSVALSDSLKTLRVQTRGKELDAHESEFARAYRVKHQDGSSRCLRFWKSVPPELSLVTIYSALEQSSALCRRSSLPVVTLFQKAITVRGTIIPAVLMDWVEGSPLGDYLAENHSKPAELRSAADALLQLFTMHNDAQISHGDLRASNILLRSNANGLHAGMIDLDSVRWSDGPALPRAVGGNPDWDDLRSTNRVAPLQHDYLDQAMIYLTFVALSMDGNRWPGSTDGFLTLDYLRGDPDETLRDLEKLDGRPGRIAASVRRVLDGQGHWLELHSAMKPESPSAPLEEKIFWDVAFGRIPPPKPAPPPGPSVPPAHKRPPQRPVPPRVANPAPVPPKPQQPPPPAPPVSLPLSPSRKSRPVWKWASWIIAIGALLAVAFYLWKIGLLFGGVNTWPNPPRFARSERQRSRVACREDSARDARPRRGDFALRRVSRQAVVAYDARAVKHPASNSKIVPERSRVSRDPERMRVGMRRSKLPSYAVCALINSASVVTADVELDVISTSRMTLGGTRKPCLKSLTSYSLRRSYQARTSSSAS